MNVEISKQEYRDLLDILSMADWVMTAHNSGKDGRTESYERLIQKFYSLAKDTSRSWEFIDEFTEDAFWDELTHRMTERDMARQAGGYEQLRSLSREEWSALEAPIHERYSEEFYRSGIERLEIAEHYGHEMTKPLQTHD